MFGKKIREKGRFREKRLKTETEFSRLKNMKAILSYTAKPHLSISTIYYSFDSELFLQNEPAQVVNVTMESCLNPTQKLGLK